MDRGVREYVAAIDPQYRALFDRLQRLILETHPDAAGRDFVQDPNL
jgi:hypothetical protein